MLLVIFVGCNFLSANVKIVYSSRKAERASIFIDIRVTRTILQIVSRLELANYFVIVRAPSFRQNIIIFTIRKKINYTESFD